MLPTSLLGAPLALLVGAAALAFTTLVSGYALDTLTINFILCVLTPVLSTRLLLACINAAHIKNLFIYTLGAGFGGGILSILAVACVSLLCSSMMGGIYLP